MAQHLPGKGKVMSVIPGTKKTPKQNKDSYGGIGSISSQEQGLSLKMLLALGLYLTTLVTHCSKLETEELWV